MALTLTVVGDVPPSIVARARAFLSGQATLEDATRAAFSLEPPRFVSAVVVQDEYTHDVVLPFEGGTHLVYDAT